LVEKRGEKAADMMAGYNGRGVHGNTVESLGARIASGEVEEGHILDLEALGAELDVSKTALREALKVLTSKGMVDARQRKGTFVRPREHWDVLDSDVIRWHRSASQAEVMLNDLAEVRSILEPAAAALAAQRRTDADIEELEGALAEMSDAATRSPEVQTAADLRWHRALLRATHNQMLAQMESIIEPALLLRDYLVHGHDHNDDPVPSHALVTEAIKSRDSERATAAAAALLRKATDDLVATLRDQHSVEDVTWQVDAGTPAPEEGRA
jgi:GntR family transcriptional regulator, galactonate operon transcriptional repressor